MFAKKLSSFPGLRKHPLRVIRYAGKRNFEIIDDKTFDEGCAAALQKAEECIAISNPTEEYADDALRKIKRAYP